MKLENLYKIAFVGDKDHGDEIISTLISWGGSNNFQRDGKNIKLVYFVNKNGEIDVFETCKLLVPENSSFVLTWHHYNSLCHIKVGESINYNGQNYDVENILYNIELNSIVYKIKAFGIGVEYITNNDLIQDEERPMEVESTGFMQMGKTVAVCFNKENYETEVELQLGDYEIEVRDGKTYAVLKKSKYPKTYVECCEVIANSKPYAMNEHYTDINKLLQTFQTLYICRNAYWKIAGEEMGLGKPWKPKFGKTILFDITFYLYQDNFVLHKGQYVSSDNCILVFPTEEMRDAFYENFKDLIEDCKELL